MRPWLVWLTGLALVVGAWVVVQVTPDEDVAVEPFAVGAALGEEATARTFLVTATDARLGDAAADADGWRAEGTWLVVDLEVEGVGTERTATGAGAALLYADLVVDGATYRASERPVSMVQTRPTVGIPRVGSIAFELPPDVVDDEAVLRLSGGWETRLDSVVEIRLDLGTLPREAEVELQPEGWANP